MGGGGGGKAELYLCSIPPSSERSPGLKAQQPHRCLGVCSSGLGDTMHSLERDKGLALKAQIMCIAVSWLGKEEGRQISSISQPWGDSFIAMA